MAGSAALYVDRTKFCESLEPLVIEQEASEESSEGPPGALPSGGWDIRGPLPMTRDQIRGLLEGESNPKP